MPKESYVPKSFQAKSMQVILRAEEICNTYAAAGYTLTLRQLYYQFVSRGWLPNKQNEYDRLGSILNDARLAGLIDWNHLEDRTRNLKANPHWGSPADIVLAAAQSYRRDLWADQPYHLEVWIEKDALTGVIEPTCQAFDLAYFACRGYPSVSEVWRAAQRLIEAEEAGRETVILHLGDHDPSGLDMTRDIQDRLETFGSGAKIERLALNMDQIQHYGPPPNPAKLTDSRAVEYIAQYGNESWELDALPPDVINDLISEAVNGYMDAELFEAAKAEQETERQVLVKLSRKWQQVQNFAASL